MQVRKLEKEEEEDTPPCKTGKGNGCTRTETAASLRQLYMTMYGRAPGMIPALVVRAEGFIAIASTCHLISFFSFFRRISEVELWT